MLMPTNPMTSRRAYAAIPSTQTLASQMTASQDSLRSQRRGGPSWHLSHALVNGIPRQLEPFHETHSMTTPYTSG